jgi:hypothetical protein
MIFIILVLFVSCQHLEERGEDVTITNNMVVGVNGLVAPWLIIAKDVVVTITQTLASAEFYVDVTNDMLVTVS